MIQEVSRWPLTAEAFVRSRFSQCRVYGGQSVPLNINLIQNESCKCGKY